jgi:hypothetical protein
MGISGLFYPKNEPFVILKYVRTEGSGILESPRSPEFRFPCWDFSRFQDDRRPEDLIFLQPLG